MGIVGAQAAWLGQWSRGHALSHADVAGGRGPQGCVQHSTLLGRKYGACASFLNVRVRTGIISRFKLSGVTVAR